MRLTNLLLLLLILVIGCQKIPILTQEKTVSKKSTVKTSEGIVFGKSTMLETKEIKAISTRKDENKHSTTFRQYIDSDSRSNQSISHNIRIGKDYYVSMGIHTRQAIYGDSFGIDTSITKYW